MTQSGGIMGTPDGPTVGELFRRFDSLVNEVREFRRDVADQQRQFAREYLRRAEYDALQASDTIQVRGLEQEVHNLEKRMEKADDRRRTDRALIFSALVAPVLVAVLTALFLRGGMG
jgi:hypothetical protein